MKKFLLASTVAVFALSGVANADEIITGSLWENDLTGASDATPSNVPTTPPDVTFSITLFGTNTFLDLQAGVFIPGIGTTPYTIGEFLNYSGGLTVNTGSSELGNTLDNTILNFTGQITVTNGQTFDLGHDDGVTLLIGGSPVVSDPGPTALDFTPYTYSGPSGTFSFQLVYGECCDAPGILEINLPWTGAELSSTPLPAALPLFATGLGAMGLLGWRRKRKAQAVAA